MATVSIQSGVWLSLARALGSGPRGRWFESSHPDFVKPCVTETCEKSHEVLQLTTDPQDTELRPAGRPLTGFLWQSSNSMGDPKWLANLLESRGSTVLRAGGALPSAAVLRVGTATAVEEHVTHRYVHLKVEHLQDIQRRLQAGH